jgi:6-pyruvoyltetrahydropterin/6-carboxytetrahydropterin synthase
MLNVILEHYFSSSHQLRLSKGLEPLHSHRWRLLLYFEPLNEHRAFNSDVFHLLQEQIQGITAIFEGKSVDNHSYFKEVNPSTENIAYFILRELESISATAGYRPVKVSLWETEDSCASWIRE